MKNLFWTLLLAILLSSCETKWGKYGGYAMDYESALDYYIVLDKSDTTYIQKWDDTRTEYEGAFIKYHKNDIQIDTIFVSKGGKVIGSYVSDVKYDNSFILVKQKPLDSICECNQECVSKKYKTWNKLPTYKLCKRALKKSTFFQYWIINKMKDVVYGPLKKEEYSLKRKELGVPDNLRLKTE